MGKMLFMFYAFAYRTGLCGKGKNSGMEVVQAGVLIAIAIIIGLIFKEQIASFINSTLSKLNKNF